MGGRALKHVRASLGYRLRALRKQHGLSQERLGRRAALSGKFIGEVERGVKSISVDSLYRVSVALDVPLRDLVDLPPGRSTSLLSEQTERVLALVSSRRRPSDLRRAYKVLHALFAP